MSNFDTWCVCTLDRGAGQGERKVQGRQQRTGCHVRRTHRFLGLVRGQGLHARVVKVKPLLLEEGHNKTVVYLLVEKRPAPKHVDVISLYSVYILSFVLDVVIQQKYNIIIIIIRSFVRSKRAVEICHLNYSHVVSLFVL